jgi:hypothetical protein
MSNVITVGEFDSSILDNARAALVGEVTKTGDLIASYAKVLCEVFNRKDTEGKTIAAWFDLKGKDAKGIKEERAKFVNAMMDKSPKFIKSITPDASGNLKRKPTATVDTYWARVKEASGYVPSGRISGANDVDAKTAAELKTMINRILKSESDGEDCHASTIRETLEGAYFVLVGEAYDADK